jgi:hypothetical protein
MSGSHTYGTFWCDACVYVFMDVKKETIIWAYTCVQMSSTEKPLITAQDSKIVRTLSVFGFHKLSEECQCNSCDNLQQLGFPHCQFSTFNSQYPDKRVYQCKKVGCSHLSPTPNNLIYSV